MDRADVVGALDAFDDGVDRRIDLAEVNGRTFVNNASMGLYAKIVQSQEYRDAKLRTAADTLPDLIGPAAVPLDLRFTLPSGEQVDVGEPRARVEQPLPALAPARAASTRPVLDTGRLGVVSVLVRGAADAEKFAALEAAGQVGRFSGWNEWTADRVRGHVGRTGRGRRRRRGPHPGARRCASSIRPGALTVRQARAVLSRRRGRARRARGVGARRWAPCGSTALGRPAVAG